VTEKVFLSPYYSSAKVKFINKQSFKNATKQKTSNQKIRMQKMGGSCIRTLTGSTGTEQARDLFEGQ
jgi:hypothetical protein